MTEPSKAEQKLIVEIAKWFFTFVCNREGLKLDWEEVKSYYLQEATDLYGFIRVVQCLSPGKAPLLTDRQRMEVNIPCEENCGASFPAWSKRCMDCIATQHGKAQNDADNKWYNWETKKEEKNGANQTGGHTISGGG